MVRDFMRALTWCGCVVFVGLLLHGGCRGTDTSDRFAPVSDGEYDSHPPIQPASRYLSRLGESVKMLSTVAYYKNYSIPESEQILDAGVTPIMLSRFAAGATYTNTSLAATTIVLSCRERRVLLLSSAHVLDYPDTILAFHPDARGHPGPYVRLVSVKEKQVNYVAVFPEGGEFEVLALDAAADVALLGHTFSRDPCQSVRPAALPLGTAAELEWGTHVFVFGYPSGFQMLTSGIVSSPRRDRRASFLVDVASSRGYSGGPVVALRDGIPNFELVGIIHQVSVHASYLLVPETEEGREYDPAVPYTGTAYPRRLTEIDHGMTQVTSAESISEFLSAARRDVESRGYSLDRVLQPARPGGTE